MIIDDIKRTCDNFVKYLQLPNSPYTILESDSSDEIEIQICKGDKLLTAITITLGTVKILFNGEFDEEKFFTKSFNSPIYLLYILLIVYYTVVGENVDLSFNDLLTIVLDDEITNWKDLAISLSNKCMLDCESDMLEVIIEDKKLSYDEGTGIITYGSLEFPIDSSSYTQLVESVFLIIEYIATVKDTQDSFLSEESEEKLIEEENENNEEESFPMGGGMDMPLGGDDDFSFSDEAPDAVTPDEAMSEDTNNDFGDTTAEELEGFLDEGGEEE